MNGLPMPTSPVAVIGRGPFVISRFTRESDRMFPP